MGARAGSEGQVRLKLGEVGPVSGIRGWSHIVVVMHPVDAFSAPRGEDFVLYLTSLNQRRGAVLLLDGQTYRQTRHTTLR